MGHDDGVFVQLEHEKHISSPGVESFIPGVLQSSGGAKNNAKTYKLLKFG